MRGGDSGREVQMEGTYVEFTLLYSRKQHNIVKQLYPNKKIINK